MTKYEHFKHLRQLQIWTLSNYLTILNTIKFLRRNSFLKNLLVVTGEIFIDAARCLGFDQNDGGGKVEGCRWNKIGQESIPVKLGCGHVGSGYVLLYFCVCLKMTKINCLKIALEDMSKRLSILESLVSNLGRSSQNLEEMEKDSMSETIWNPQWRLRRCKVDIKSEF